LSLSSSHFLLYVEEYEAGIRPARNWITSSANVASNESQRKTDNSLSLAQPGSVS